MHKRVLHQYWQTQLGKWQLHRQAWQQGLCSAAAAHRADEAQQATVAATSWGVVGAMLGVALTSARAICVYTPGTFNDVAVYRTKCVQLKKKNAGHEKGACVIQSAYAMGRQGRQC